MNTIIFTAKCIIVFASFLIVSRTYSQWQQTSGPGGGYSTGLFAKGDTLFTGNYAQDPYFHPGPTQGTIYRSTNHGVTWQADSIGFYGKVTSFAYMGNTVFAATRTDGIFKSTNNGTTWSRIPNSSDLSPYSLLAVNDVLYVGSATYGMYKSTNKGDTFKPVSNGLPDRSFVERITHVGKAIFIGLTSINGNGIFRSVNNGVSWQAVNNGFDPGIFEYQFKFGNFTKLGNKLFISVNDTVRVTTDLGDHWTIANTGINGLADRIVAAGNNLYVSVLAGTWSIYKSTNNGTSWAKTGPGYPGSDGAFEMVNIGNEVYAGTGYYASVYRTVNGGASWEAANIGLPNAEIRAIFTSGNTIFSAGLNVPGIHKSIDGGNTWQPSGNGLPYDLITAKAFTQNSNYLFAGFDLYGVYRSNNNGASWQAAAKGFSIQGRFINSLTVKGNTVFAGTYEGVFKSANNGNNWTLASPVVNGTAPEIKAVTALNNYVFAATPTNGIFRSGNNGSSWQAVNSGLHTSQIYSFTVSGNKLIAGTMKGIYISTDNGTSWTEKNNGLPANFNGDRFARTVTAKGDTLFTALYDLSQFASMGIFKSVDNGNYWTKYTDFPDLFAVSCLTVAGNTLFAGTETESIWKNSTYAPTGVAESSVITQFKTGVANITATEDIRQHNFSVYPNPAKNSVTLTFTAPLQALYTVHITDLEGKALLQKSFTANAGSNNFTIDISKLSSGGYILILQNNKERVMQKIMKQ